MKSTKKRKARNKIDKERIDFFKPVDIFALGGENDPCFGTQYSLSASECGRCGDSELCVIKMMQNQKQVREKIDDKNHFKDSEDTYIHVEKYLLEKLEGRTVSVKKVIEKVRIKFLMPDSEQAKKLLMKTFKFSGKFKKEGTKLSIK